MKGKRIERIRTLVNLWFEGQHQKVVKSLRRKSILRVDVLYVLPSKDRKHLLSLLEKDLEEQYG